MSRNSRKANVLLWTAQIILALLFGFAGGMKLVLPFAALDRGPIHFPEAFLRFIGTAELLGGLGLVLPGLFRIRQSLTPLAAAGLVVIMTGASIVSAISLGLVAAAFPFVMGLLAAAVCAGRGGIVFALGREAAERAPLFQS